MDISQIIFNETNLLLIIIFILIIQVSLQTGFLNMYKPEGYDSMKLRYTSLVEEAEQRKEKFGTGPEITAGKYNFESSKGPANTITHSKQLNDVVEGLNLLNQDEGYASVTQDDSESYSNNLVEGLNLLNQGDGEGYASVTQDDPESYLSDINMQE